MSKYTIPFYGVRGSIASIENLGEYFKVVQYDFDGKYLPSLNIRNTKGARKDLFDIYYKNAYSFLKTKEKDYLKAKKDNKIIDKSKEDKMKKLLYLSVGIGLLPSAIGIIGGIDNFFNVGISTFIIGSCMSTASIISLNKINDAKSGEKLIRDYEIIRMEVVEHERKRQEEIKNKEKKNKIISAAYKFTKSRPYEKKKIKEDKMVA